MSCRGPQDCVVSADARLDGPWQRMPWPRWSRRWGSDGGDMDPAESEPRTTIEELTHQLSSGTIDRRTFLRRGTMLAVSLPPLSAIIAACSSPAPPGAAAAPPRALVLLRFGEPAIQPILDAAHAKGVKVIGYGNIIPGLDFSLIRDNEKVGVIMGEAAKAYAPKGNYAFSWGAVGNDVGEGKKKGSLSVLQPLVDSGDIKVVSEQHTTDWASTGVQTQIDAALTLVQNDLQAIVCSWDSGSIGAYAAVKAAGVDKKVFITGEDADPTRVQLIAAGYPATTTLE